MRTEPDGVMTGGEIYTLVELSRIKNIQRMKKWLPLSEHERLLKEAETKYSSALAYNSGFEAGKREAKQEVFKDIESTLPMVPMMKGYPIIKQRHLGGEDASICK